MPLTAMNTTIRPTSAVHSVLRGGSLSGCSAVGSAHGLGPWGREFEPPHSDQLQSGGTYGFVANGNRGSRSDCSRYPLYPGDSAYETSRGKGMARRRSGWTCNNGHTCRKNVLAAGYDFLTFSNASGTLESEVRLYGGWGTICLLLYTESSCAGACGPVLPRGTA